MALQDETEVKRPTDLLSSRLVRYGALIPCLNAFIDTRSPGSEAKENFTIIGPGVSENPDQHVHIAEAHGFNIGGARQPPNCVNSQHSHGTAEVFVVLNGEWSFDLGETGKDASVRLAAGDIISLPTNMFRGFENVGTGTGFLWAVLGGDDPGRVLWAPYVFDMAKEYGLVLLENGSLVDTSKGERVPANVSAMPPTDAAMMAGIRRLDAAAIRRCVVRGDESDLALGPLSRFPGVSEAALIGPANPAEAIGAGRMGWSHGFQVRRLTMAEEARVPEHVRSEPEVLFVQRGSLTVFGDTGSVTMAPGDTLTIPIGQAREYRSGEGATVFAVHGGDHPAAPVWSD